MYLVDTWGGKTPADIRAQGADGVMCYISPTDGQPGSKDATPAEVHAYRSDGLWVGLNWESTGTTFTGGYAAGVADAQAALLLIEARGYPKGCAVYFSLDTYVSDGQLGAAQAYADGIRSVLAPAGWLTGVYGSYYVMESVVGGGHADSGWQTIAWSNGLLSAHACLYQDAVGNLYDQDAVEAPYPPLWGAPTSPTPPEEDNVQFVDFTTEPCRADGNAFTAAPGQAGALQFPKGTSRAVGIIQLTGAGDDEPAAVSAGLRNGIAYPNFIVRISGGKPGVRYSGHVSVV